MTDAAKKLLSLLAEEARALEERDRTMGQMDRISHEISRVRAERVIESGALRTVKWTFGIEGSVAYGITCNEPEKILSALPEVFADEFLPWVNLSQDGKVQLCVRHDNCAPPGSSDERNVTIRIDKSMSPRDIMAWLHALGLDIDTFRIRDEIAKKKSEIERLRAIASQFSPGKNHE